MPPSVASYSNGGYRRFLVLDVEATCIADKSVEWPNEIIVSLAAAACRSTWDFPRHFAHLGRHGGRLRLCVGESSRTGKDRRQV